VEFEIFSHLRHRYGRASTVIRNPGSVLRSHEREIVFTEHLTYRWVDAADAAAPGLSWSNRQAIEEFVINVN
jgi:dATP pyrophosphohydrolase